MKNEAAFLWQYLEKWSSEKPEDEALVFGDVRMTWGQFAEAVENTARALLDIGVEKGDCIAMIAMACPEFLISFMAAAKISAIWTGISPKLSIGETGRILRDCRPSVLITLDRYNNSNLLERALTFSFELPCINEILVIGQPANGAHNFDTYTATPRPHLDTALADRIRNATPDDEVLLMYTSGSSGTPKGVLHSHRAILSNVRQQQPLFEISSDSRILLHFPINHVAADVEIGFCAIYAGACIVMMDSFNAEKALEIIEAEQITVLGQVPAMYLLEQRSEQYKRINWDSVKTFVWGGSAAPENMIKDLAAICRRTGARMITGYGATELGGFVTATLPDDSLEQLGRSVGPAFDNCEIRIVDEQRKPIPTGEVGEIAVRGPMVMRGYLNNPEQTAEVLDNTGWYYTNDLGRLDASGRLSICGRLSEMYKIGGENVYPCEIEAVLESHPAVLYAAIITMTDDVYDEVGHAHVMTSQGANVTSDALLDWCKMRLAPFKIPRSITIHKQLPLLANGKVDKMRLRAMIATQNHGGKEETD